MILDRDLDALRGGVIAQLAQGRNHLRPHCLLRAGLHPIAGASEKQIPKVLGTVHGIQRLSCARSEVTTEHSPTCAVSSFGHGARPKTRSCRPPSSAVASTSLRPCPMRAAASSAGPTNEPPPVYPMTSPAAVMSAFSLCRLAGDLQF